MWSVQGNVYKMGKEIGSGAYGSVYTVTRVKDDKQFAYKIYSTSSRDLDVGALREISLLQMLKRSGYCEEYGIICMEDIIISDDSVGIVLPLYTLSLDIAIDTNILSGHDKLIIYHKLLRSICFLHENNIIHRDIKPDNVMLDSNYNPVLIDFTLAKYFNTTTSEETHTGGISTFNYRAPEVKNKKSYGFPADAWSLGVVLQELYGTILPIFAGFLDHNPDTRLIPSDALYDNFQQICMVFINYSIAPVFVDETIKTICDNLEINKPITYRAAQVYYTKTNCDPYIAVLLACKYYETDLIDIECIDMDMDYSSQELAILKKMDYDLNVS